MSEGAPLFGLAKLYYSRFQIEIQGWKHLTRKHLFGATVIDEGKVYPLKLQHTICEAARRTKYIRVGARLFKGLPDLTVSSVEHHKVGGVSDAESFILESLSKGPSGSLDETFPSRDLRHVLKSGIDGKPCSKPYLVPTEAGKVTKFLRPNEISCCGLFPWAQLLRPVKARTKFGSKTWVSREISLEEKLIIGDVPEPLLLLLNTQSNSSVMTRHLLASCKVPLKSLRILLMRSLRERRSSDIEPQSTDPINTKIFSDGSVERKDPDTQPQDLGISMIQELSDLESVAVLQKVLLKSILGSRDENRSKTSDYDEAFEPLWDFHVLFHCRVEDELGNPLNWKNAFRIVRKFLSRYWKRRILKSWIVFKCSVRQGSVSKEDREAFSDCLRRTGDATHWSWPGGSRPFFWRWDSEWQLAQREGFKQWLRPEARSLRWFHRQPRVSPEHQVLISKKLSDVRYKNYIGPGKVKSMMSYFNVPKGDSDIRMVYDGTKSGLNSVMWAPWFPLPTASTLLRMVESGTWMADNDAGECFINWLLHKDVQELCGVDITQFGGPEEIPARVNTPAGRLLLEVWNRCAMGLKSSPYIAIKSMLLIKEKILGNRHDPDNVFRWDYVLLNLPGMESYDSSKPWVSKRRKDGCLAADCLSFVDDYRECGPSEREVWKAGQQIACTMASHGAQDASRKRGFPSHSPGPWAGIVVITKGDGVFISVSTKKWEKTKSYLEEIRSYLSSGKIPYKLLEKRCGYLVYVAQAFPSMRPSLVGLYGSLNSWRPDRTPDGFKLPMSAKRRKLNPKVKRDFEEETDWKISRLDRDDIGDETTSEPSPGDAPAEVNFTSRAQSDIEFLIKLTSSKDPIKRRVRGNKMVSLVYGFGDASGKGFGAAVQLASGEVFYRTGLWDISISEEMSSNYRELKNLVDSIEHAHSTGLLDGCQLMMFTDNATAESAFHKGASSSPALHDLVQRLRLIEMEAGAELFVVHVSGKRMIESGVDGLSRGDLNAGIMNGQSVYSFIPLHLSALERSPSLLNWILDWTGSDTVLLGKDQWPEEHPDRGTYFWSPPPSAADAALDWMGESIHKRSTSIHIMVVPRLMTFRWRKLLMKNSDLTLTIPCGSPCWPTTTLEPLILGVSLPLSTRCNENGSWRYKGSRRISDLESRVPRMWESEESSIRNSLRKLLDESRGSRAL